MIVFERVGAAGRFLAWRAYCEMAWGASIPRTQDGEIAGSFDAEETASSLRRRMNTFGGWLQPRHRRGAWLSEADWLDSHCPAMFCLSARLDLAFIFSIFRS